MTTLAELRQASLKEQKQKEQQNAPEQIPATQVAEVLAAPPVSAANGVTPTAKINGHHTPAPDAVVAASGTASAPAPPAVPSPVVPVASPEALRAEKYFARLHETLSHKTLHPSGAKVSADMPPALFHRAKRYCLDHGNITLRQVLIDLLTSYLEEEGY
jgi:hypothetical protein